MAAVEGCSVDAAAAEARAIVRPAFNAWPRTTTAISGA